MPDKLIYAMKFEAELVKKLKSKITLPENASKTLRAIMDLSEVYKMCWQLVVEFYLQFNFINIIHVHCVIFCVSTLWTVLLQDEQMSCPCRWYEQGITVNCVRLSSVLTELVWKIDFGRLRYAKA